MVRHGRVIEEQKKYYLVDTNQDVIQAVFKGTVKKDHKRLYVGDMVEVEQFNTDSPEGIIRSVSKRKNVLLKPPIANLDQVILINTIREPHLDLDFLDRFLFAAEVLDLPTVIVFNKMDLLDDNERTSLDTILDYYHNIGYTTLVASAFSPQTLLPLCDLCQNMFSIFAGQSGTGKSTLLSKIFPDKSFRVSELSKHIHRGVHTTTSTTLLKMSSGGFIADSPGFSFIDLPEVSCDLVVSYFKEFAPYIGKCKFNNCTHESEPGCVIRELVDKNDILMSRYENYRKILLWMRKKSSEYGRKKTGR